MSHDRNNPDPREEADDESSMSSDVESGALFVDLDRLRELCRSVPPPQPTEAEWTALLTRVHDAVRPVPVRLAEANGRSTNRAARRRRAAVVGMAAAAALIAVLLSQSWWRETPSPQLPVEEPFVVAAAEDVDIISIDARDVAGLVVGEPPVSGELIFARPNDVRVVECKCCPKSGNVARLRQGEVPMLVTSAARVGGPGDE